VPDLTDAQREQIRAIADRHQAEMRPLLEKLRTAQVALEDAIVTNPTDEATIRLRSADVASAEADLAVVRGQVYAEVVALLTPEQQQKLQQQRQQMKQRRADGPRARRQ
jgi:Spy/CpxP family protein refolding chaperone